jgi:hypothetical protein
MADTANMKKEKSIRNMKKKAPLKRRKEVKDATKYKNC